MRFRFFTRLIFAGLIVQVAIFGLDADRLRAQAAEPALSSSNVSTVEAINIDLVGCDFCPALLQTSLRLEYFKLHDNIGAFDEFSLGAYGGPSAPPAEARAETLRTRAFEYYYVLGPGCGMCGGLNEAPFYSLELGGGLWVARYWEVRGTYIDHLIGGGLAYQYTTAWSLDVGKKMGEVTVYAGWANLRHYWSSTSWTDLEGPTLGARWSTGSLSFDLALRHASPSILGNSVKVTLNIPISDNVSTTIGLDQWVYFLAQARYYQWTNPYIGLKTEW